MLGVFQLEARQFQHPHVGRLAFALHISLQHRRADIACHDSIEAALFAQIADQAGDGGFAVAAGDGDDFVALALQHACQHFDVAEHAATVLLKRFDFRRALADAGAERQHLHACQGIIQTACVAF